MNPVKAFFVSFASGLFVLFAGHGLYGLAESAVQTAGVERPLA